MSASDEINQLKEQLKEAVGKSYIDNSSAKAVVGTDLSATGIYDGSGGYIISSGPAQVVSLPSNPVGNVSFAGIDSYTVVLGDPVEEMLKGLQTTLQEKADTLKDRLKNLAAEYEEVERIFNETTSKVSELGTALEALCGEPDDELDEDDIPF